MCSSETKPHPTRPTRTFAIVPLPFRVLFAPTGTLSSRTSVRKRPPAQRRAPARRGRGVIFMLSFQVIREGRTIQICCDDQGVDALMAVLKKLRGSGSHVHLSAHSTGA